MTTYITSLILLYSSQFNIDPQVVMGVIESESSFRPNVISKTGDVGLMQLNLKVYKKYTKKQLLDVKTNLYLGIKHLSEAKKLSKHKKNLAWLTFYNTGYVSNSFKYPELHKYVKKVKKNMQKFDGYSNKYKLTLN